MLVLRLEHSNGAGIYRHDDMGAALINCQLFDHDLYNLHPTPDQDRLMRDEWNKLQLKREALAYRFGFLDAQQLERYVISPDVMKALGRRNVYLREYEILSSLVIRGETQCAFRYPDAYRNSSIHAGDYKWLRLA